jgi:ADP-ribosyl-[dinitrogen reductase] hydrolase
VTLPIATIPLEEGGRIGLSHCPGMYDAANPARDLAGDLGAIHAWGAVGVVTCVEQHELERLRIPDLGRRVEAAGMAWVHLPIRDMMAPDAAFEVAWHEAGPRLHAWLGQGRSVHLHCRGGRGRAGTVAARILIERGMRAGDAIRLVRTHRPGAIETTAQQAYLEALGAGDGG